MRALSLPTQFILFLLIQGVLGFVFLSYLQTTSTQNVVLFKNMINEPKVLIQEVEAQRQKLSVINQLVERATSQFRLGSHPDITEPVAALRAFAGSLGEHMRFNGADGKKQAIISQLKAHIEQQAEQLLRAAAITPQGNANELKLILQKIDQDRSDITITEFGQLTQLASSKLNQSIQAIQLAIGQRIKQNITLFFSFIVLQISLMVLIFWFFNRQLSRVADAYERLSSGDVNAILPKPDRPDQIGRITRSIQFYQQALVAASNTRDRLKILLEKNRTEVFARKKLEQQQITAMSVFEHIQEAVIVTDAEGRVETANPAALVLLNTQMQVLATTHLLERLLNTTSEVLKPIWEQIIEQGYWQGELTLQAEPKREQVVHASIKRIGSNHLQVKQVVFVLTDQTESRSQEKTLRTLLERDFVTNLYNREFYIDEGLRRINDSPKTPFAVALLSIDEFKLINDALGYADGNQVLFAFSHKLKKMIEPNAFLARISGIEFAFFIRPESSSNIEQDVYALLSDIIKELREPIDVNGFQIALNVSGSFSIYPFDAENMSDLLKTNNIALQAARRQGGNRILPPAASRQHTALHHFKLQQALNKAQENRELRLVYQPQVSLATGEILGFEVLMRWKHQDKWISPSDFIPIAEETDLIVAMTEWAFLESCQRVYEWQKNTNKKFTVSVNLPPKLLLIEHIAQRFFELAKQTRLALSYIVLEVTESGFGGNPKFMAAQLHQFAMRGFTIAIDDFGTGYSSLSYLSTLPIDKIKIDKSFVDRIIDDRDAAQLIGSIFAMAQALEFDIVLEGVETYDQIQELKKFNIDMAIQGYVFERPQTEDYWTGIFLHGKAAPYVLTS
ncbi:MAG: EAL domain-containing protein [Halothiobacillaceae bacterium]|nr:EAL domain-containing protein [Halothiobacillaceae bacterium]